MNIKDISNLILLIWYVVFVILFIYIYFRYYKEYESNYKEKETNKLPSNLGPLKLSLLMYNKITKSCFISTIYFLILKNKIIVSKEEYGYVLKLNYEKMKLSDSQNYILKILFEQIGDGQKLTLTELNNYCSSAYNKEEFSINYYIWEKMAYKESSNNNFYIPKYIYFKIKLISVITLCIFVFGLIVNLSQIFNYFLIPLLSVLVIFIEKTKKRTKKANDEYYKWLSYKKYLQENNLENNKEIYLVYGTILGINNIMDKIEFNEFFKELESSINNNLKTLKR